MHVVLRPVYSDTTQLNSTSNWVELSRIARDTLTDATQLSPTIGNATDPVEQRTANQREAGQSSRVELCRYKRAFKRLNRPRVVYLENVLQWTVSERLLWT